MICLEHIPNTWNVKWLRDECMKFTILYMYLIHVQVLIIQFHQLVILLLRVICVVIYATYMLIAAARVALPHTTLEWEMNVTREKSLRWHDICVTCGSHRSGLVADILRIVIDYCLSNKWHESLLKRNKDNERNK